MEIDLPAELPVMTLPRTVFFPQTMLPLHIFEPRYRQMLADVLASHRMFAVAQLDERAGAGDPAAEPPHRIATAGIVRACQLASDGTSNLLLHGLCRIEILRILRDEPYRSVELRPALPAAGASEPELRDLCRAAATLLQLKRQLGLPLPEEFSRVVEGVDDPRIFANLAGFTMIESHELKQRLLESPDLRAQLALLQRTFAEEIRLARLQRRLQGGLADGDIPRN